MAVNKIVLNTDDGEQVLVDLTGDSVSEGTLFKGETAHAANGEKIVGAFTLESEMSEQDALIEQIKTALQGKTAGGGGGSGEGVETCNVTLNSFNDIGAVAYTSFEGGMTLPHMIKSDDKNITLTNVVCGSAIAFYNTYAFNGFTHSHDSSVVGHYTHVMWVLSAPQTANVDATITIYDDD